MSINSVPRFGQKGRLWRTVLLEWGHRDTLQYSTVPQYLSTSGPIFVQKIMFDGAAQVTPT